MLPVAVAPSPKFQLKEYGGVPPEAVPEKVTVWPGVGDIGLNEKLACNCDVALPILANLIVVGVVVPLE